MTTLGTETWTGTTGAAWASQWINGSTQGTATIQANAGRLLADGNGYRRVNRFLNVAAVGKSEVYVEVTLSALTEHYSWVFLRANSASGDQAYPLGYGVVFGPGDNTYTMELGYGTGESLATTAPITYVAANRYGVRLRADGTSFMSRVWNLTGTEPTSWALTNTDTDNTFTTGRVELGYMSGSAANPGTTFDNLTLTDAAVTAAPSRAGSMMLAF
jgi:hypothetical protein